MPRLAPVISITPMGSMMSASTVRNMSGLSDRSVQDDPFPYYRERLGSCPVWHEADVDLYVIAGLEEARAAAMDVETFSSAPSRHGRAASPAALAYVRKIADEGWGRATT